MNNKFVFIGTALAIIILLGFVFESFKDEQVTKDSTDYTATTEEANELQNEPEEMDSTSSATTSVEIEIKSVE